MHHTHIFLLNITKISNKYQERKLHVYYVWFVYLDQRYDYDTVLMHHLVWVFYSENISISIRSFINILPINF